MENKIEFRLWGRKALFTDPLTKIGGEKCSYQIPTYQGLKGIAESIYWKPTFIWVIDRVRIMRKIQTQSISVKPIDYSGGSLLSIYTYLSDVEYQIQAHFEWNLNREDLEQDRNENKHFFVAKRMLERGGRRDIFLGTRECQGYVEPCIYNEGIGQYDEVQEMAFGLMYHGISYPDETEGHMMTARFFRPVMRNGIVDFPRSEDCTIIKEVRKMKAAPPQTSGLLEEGLLDGFREVGS